MKTLLMIRHAKSNWGAPSLKDIDRTLNDRGNKDAPEMARWLKNKYKKIDLFVSSPATRARQTCAYFCEEYGVKKDKVLFVDELYQSSVSMIEKVIASLDGSFDCVAVFSHNPGITDFVNTLCPKVAVDNIPTTGIFCVEAKIKDWKEFTAAEKEFVFFESPKTSL